MAVETSALPSVENHTPRIEEWVRQGSRSLARNPGYVLAAAVVAGFITGRVVKRLLFSAAGGEHERYDGRH